MPKRFSTKIGERDIEILAAIDRCPLTVRQLCKLSQTFAAPFKDEHNLRRRLRALSDSGLLKSWPYAIACDGASPRYFKLSREGFRLLHGQDVATPKRRRFEEISHGHHYHTHALADLIVHLCVCAEQKGVVLRHFAAENSLRLEANGFTMYPDCAFQLVAPNGRGYNFAVELDNGTERIQTRKDVESIERKLRGYDAHQQQYAANDAGRYLVLFVTTRTKNRTNHIMQLADGVMQNRQRTVFVGSEMGKLLSSDPVSDPVLQDHRGLKRSLLPRQAFGTFDSPAGMHSNMPFLSPTAC